MLTERFDRFFRSDDAKEKEADEILSLLKNSPELKERQRQRDDKRVASVRELLAKREEIQREKESTMPALIAARAAAEEREKQAHEALQAATQERVNAEHARFSASLDFSAKLSKIEGELTKLAPREIDEFIWQMQKAEIEARSQVKVEHRPGPRSRFTGVVTSLIVESNRKDVDQKLAYIRAAIEEARAMKFQALPHEQIVSRLAELEAGIPKETRGEVETLPFPDVRELRA